MRDANMQPGSFEMAEAERKMRLQMDVKGRVQMDKAEEYMRSLKSSRSRILSLALLRCLLFSKPPLCLRRIVLQL